MRVRGGRGLGDSLYVRVVAEHLVKKGQKVTVCADYPGLFEGAGVTVEPFGRNGIDVLAHYTFRKPNPGSTQWEDVCASARIEPIPLRIEWTVKNRGLVDGLRALAGEKPLIIVHGGRRPMGRTDGFGMELLPEKAAFDAVLKALGDCFLVQVGQAEQVYPLGCDVSLNGSTSVTDLLDLAKSCDAVVAQCSFAVPLAEVFDKPAMFVWAAKGLTAGSPYVRQITPVKVLSKPSSHYVMDNWPQIGEVVQAFRASL